MSKATMTTETALHNIQAYVTMLEYGEVTKSAYTRYLYAIGHMAELANYMHFRNYAEYGKIEDKNKTYEEEHGKNETPRIEIEKCIKRSNMDNWFCGGKRLVKK